MISLDPAMRGWLDDRPSYLPRSRSTRSSVRGPSARSSSRVTRGSPWALVQGGFGVQEYASRRTARASYASIPALGTPSMYLGVLGMTGMTAYFGLFEHGRPRAGDTVLVSAAAGAVGSIAGQLALDQRLPCRGRRRRRGQVLLRHRHAGLPRRRRLQGRGSVRRPYREALSDGIDLYFDNVGGDGAERGPHQPRDARAHRHLRSHLAVQRRSSHPGPSNYMALLVRRATMTGFLVFDHAAEYRVARQRMAQWVAEGRIVAPETIVAGAGDRLPRGVPAPVHR